jgi:hypothetical protein
MVRAEVSVTEEPDAGKPHVRDCVGGAGQPAFLPRDNEEFSLMANIRNHQNKFGTFPARVFALVPENSDNAIVIRRGPSKIVGIFEWNIRTDKIKSYQWLKGRIYEYFCDISSNGTYLIYSANKKGYGYTVISRSPWLKALSLWNNVGGWGGGLFFGDSKYLLYDGSENYCKLRSIDLSPNNSGSQQIKNGVYPARLLRSGWKIKSQKGPETIFNKFITTNFVLQKVWKRNKGHHKGHGEFSEFHRVISNSETKEFRSWEWCEWLNNNIVWSENGCLFRASLEDQNSIGKPSLIYDFNQKKFEERVAPY